MRIYLDVCALNRPFDDQTQSRVRMEADAVRVVFETISRGTHEWISSAVVGFEVSRMADSDRKTAILELLKHSNGSADLTQDVEARAREFERCGLSPIDALHLAAAEGAACDALLTTDDGFIRRSQRINPPPRTRVVNAANWAVEVTQL